MTPKTPYRQIRAQYDDQTVTVYQAYKTSIAEAAVKTQKLNASPEFRSGRMTWIKPSWSWMMYRAGYSYKDPGQSRILALRMKHEHFLQILERGVFTTRGSSAPGEQPRPKHPVGEKSADVKIQWDPERTPGLQILPYRSIQIGIPGALSDTWAGEWIHSIEDVTERARELKKTLDEQPAMTVEELVELGLVPSERPYEVSERLQTSLRMDATVPCA